MKYDRLRGSTSNMVRVFIPDNTSTTGAGLTGLTSGSTNLTIAYMRELDGVATTYTGANIEAQTTVGTFQAPSSSSKVRFKAVDAANFPGVYELQFHDSATIFGTGDASRNVQINIFEATTTALKIGPCMSEIRLIAWDMQTALSSTTIGTVTTYTGNTPQTGDAYARIGAAGAGLTALGDGRIANLDAAVSTRSTYAGGAVASVTGSVGSVASYGTLVSDIATAVWNAGTRTLTSLGSVVADTATAVWGAVSRTITGTVTLDATQGSYAPAKAGDAMTLTSAYDAAKTAASQTSVNAIPTSPLLAINYTAPDNTGIGVAAAAAVSAANDAATIKAKTNQLTFTVANQVDANALTGGLSAADVRSAVGLATANLDAQLGALPTVDDIVRTALTESYAANGAAPTLEQAVYATLAMIAGAKKAIVGTTLTIYKLDGVTPAMTFTLDKAKSPTSQARAT